MFSFSRRIAAICLDVNPHHPFLPRTSSPYVVSTQLSKTFRKLYNAVFDSPTTPPGFRTLLPHSRHPQSPPHVAGTGPRSRTAAATATTALSATIRQAMTSQPRSAYLHSAYWGHHFERPSPGQVGLIHLRQLKPRFLRPKGGIFAWICPVQPLQ
jgi:hypothetical protein